MSQVQPVFIDPASLRSMITPEGVDLRLSLADVGQRFSAFILDQLLIGVINVVLALALIAMLIALGGHGWQPVAIFWLIGSFLVRNFYFVAFEAGPRGATPGKRRMGIRVAARNGGRLTVDAVFIRNVMRELEFYLPLQVFGGTDTGVDAWIKLLALVWCAVFALFPLFNRDRLRIGDLLAGTWVVRSPKRKLAADLVHTGLQERSRLEFSQTQIDAYGIKELHVLEDVLRRFDRPTIKLVADRVRAKIGYAPGEESDGAFLSAYYAALRARLEARALLGKRRADKHDKS